MNALIRIDTATVSMYEQIARYLATSGFFKLTGANQPKTVEEMTAQAFVKIMAGHELGIGPVLAMQHIHVIDGKTSMDATLVAGKIKGSGKYDYDVEKMDAKGCVITFFQIDGGQRRKLGTATWVEADAKAAGLIGRGNWGKYPRDMYASRCITFGARRYCPDVFLGPIYTPEELGADIPPAAFTEQVPAPVQALTSGDGHATTAAPVAQLTAPAEPDYDKLLDKIATRLQKVASAPQDEWEAAYNGAIEFTANWPDKYRDDADELAAKISGARQLAIEDAEERDAMQAE